MEKKHVGVKYKLFAEYRMLQFVHRGCIESTISGFIEAHSKIGLTCDSCSYSTKREQLTAVVQQIGPSCMTYVFKSPHSVVRWA